MRLHRVLLAACVTVLLLVSNLAIANPSYADAAGNSVLKPISSLSLAQLPSNIRVGPIDAGKIDPDVFKNPEIPKGGLNLRPSVSGKIKFLKGQYGAVPQCQNAEVYLISNEYTEEPAPTPIPGTISGGKIRKPIFTYKGKISPDPNGKSDTKTTYCKYSVSAAKKFVGKKASVYFNTNTGGIDCYRSDDSDTGVIIPDKPIEKNYQKSICGIG
jgi:hypothetical protein